MENIQDYLRPWQLGPMVAVLGAWLFGGGYLLAARYARFKEQRHIQYPKGVIAAMLAAIGGMVGGGILFLITYYIGASSNADLRIVAVAPGAIGAFFTACLVLFAFYDMPFMTALRIGAVPLLIGGCVTAAVCIAIFVPMRGVVTEIRNREFAKQQIQVIDMVLRNSPTPPQTLEEVVAQGNIGPEVVQLYARKDKAIGFFYFPGLPVERSVPTTRLRACEFSHKYNQKSRVVLFANGESRSIATSEFEALLNDPVNAEFKSKFSAADWR